MIYNPAMPAFVASVALSVAPGDNVSLFNAETVAANSQSEMITRSPSPDGAQQPISFQGKFATSPTATWSVQASNTPLLANFQTLATVTGNGVYTDTNNFAFYSVLVNTYSAGGAFTCVAHC